MTYDAALKLYYIDVDINAGYNMIIFTDGAGTQTKDLQIPATKDSVYDYSLGNWKTK